MESCPNCGFLIREDSATCGVCGSPHQLAGTRAGPSGSAAVAATRVGPSHTRATPVAAVALLVLIVLLGAAAGWAAMVMP